MNAILINLQSNYRLCSPVHITGDSFGCVVVAVNAEMLHSQIIRLLIYFFFTSLKRIFNHQLPDPMCMIAADLSSWVLDDNKHAPPINSPNLNAAILPLNKKTEGGD